MVFLVVSLFVQEHRRHSKIHEVVELTVIYSSLPFNWRLGVVLVAVPEQLVLQGS